MKIPSFIRPKYPLLLVAALGGLFSIVGPASATTRYVDLHSPNPTPPFTNWITAATNIQDAVDSAAPGDEVIVTNGIYATGGRAAGTNAVANRVAVEKPLALHSVNGPQFTYVDGGNTFRCVYLNSGASLSGLTLTNGAADSGGGVWCESLTTIVSNCVIVANAANGIYTGGNGGGGAYRGTLNNCVLSWNWGGGGSQGGGAYGSTLNNCALTDNFADYGGGASVSTLNNCTLSGNQAQDGGGGAYGCTLTNCTLIGNWTVAGYSSTHGGGAYRSSLDNCLLTGNYVSCGFPNYGGGASYCALNRCTLLSNHAGDWFGCGGQGYGGGASYSTLNSCTLGTNGAIAGHSSDAVFGGDGGGAYACALTNCLLIANAAGEAGGGANWCTLENCTLTGNSAGSGGGVSGYAYDDQTGETNRACLLNNCIVYLNTAALEPNYDTNALLNYCCTTPIPTNGVGNITNAPLFVDYAGGNLRLQSNSPCINAGNNAYVAGPHRPGRPPAHRRRHGGHRRLRVPRARLE